MATVAAVRAQVRRDVVRLAHRGLAVPEYSRAVIRLLQKAVRCEGVCVLTLDPATLLPTGDVVENALPPEVMPRYLEIELREPDVNKFTVLARRRQPAASLSGATRGQLDRSRRQREIRRPSGYADELRMTLSTAMGTWGAVTLMREADRPHFTPADVRFLSSLATPLVDGLRRAALLAPDAADEGPGEEAGLVVLAPDDSVELANRAAQPWLDELHPGEGTPDAIPSVVLAVANAARRTAELGDDPAPDTLARARVRTAAGRWVLVRGSLLGAGPRSPVAVLFEPARPPELAPIIADAYGFTERERAIVELVAQGFATREIAARLHLSAYTVQDHLKSVFDKSGTGSRGDLVARLYHDHYQTSFRRLTLDRSTAS